MLGTPSPSDIIDLTWLEPTKADGALAKISHKPIRLDSFALVDTNFIRLHPLFLILFSHRLLALHVPVDENTPHHVFSRG